MKYRYSLEITENFFDSLEDMFKTLKKIGFSALDYSGARTDFPRIEDERTYCNKIKDLAQEYDFSLYQMHAPFLINKPEEEFLGKHLYTCVVKSIERGARLGIRNIVAHPYVPEGLDFFRDAKPYDYSKLVDHNKEINLEFFSQFTPLLKKEGMTMCIENLFAYDILMQRHAFSVCSDPDETNYYIDNLGADCFAACYDSGHLNLHDGDEYNYITKLGKRIRVLHLNDSWGKFFKGMDWHMMPGNGDVNWSAIKKGLTEIEYNGTINGEITLHKGPMFIPMLTYIYQSLSSIMEGDN